MLLSVEDMRSLENAGYATRDFVRYDRQGFARLKNVFGRCFFLDPNNHRCKVYGLRPLGCQIYPVIYSEEEGVIIDDLCPARNTILDAETRRKGRMLVKLLKKIDDEAETRRGSAGTANVRFT